MAKQTKGRGRKASGASLGSLEAAFERGEFAPVYLVYGPEEFQKTSLQDALLRTALRPGERDFNLDLLYGNETDAHAVIGLCYGLPMMAERRVVIVRDFEKLEDNQLFVNYAEKPNPSAVVMLVCRGKPNMATNPYRAIKSKSVGVLFEPPRDHEMARWIGSHVKRTGRAMDPRASQMLADVVGTDVQSAVLEIDKLITFAGTRKRIEADDVIRASGQTREHNVFELQKAVGRADYGRSLEIAERLLRQAPNPIGEGLRMVSILSAYFAKLWILSECQSRSTSSGELATRVGIPSYYIQEYLSSLRYYRGTALEVAFSALLAADFELKGGSVRDPRLIVNLMLRRMVP
jgi:DNA polymerase-3 subunit delta